MIGAHRRKKSAYPKNVKYKSTRQGYINIMRHVTGSKTPRFFKLRSTTDITANAGGVIANTVENNPSGLTDWGSVANLFDSYRVTAIKVKYIPELPNDTSTTTGFFAVYVVYDEDDVTALSSIAQAVGYENMKVKNMYRPWSYYHKIERSAPASEVIIEGKYRDTANTTAYNALKMYGTGFDVNQRYGTLIITQYITAKNRR